MLRSLIVAVVMFSGITNPYVAIAGPSISLLPTIGQQQGSARVEQIQISGLKFSGNAVTAIYPIAGHHAQLFIARYRSNHQAARAYASSLRSEHGNRDLRHVSGMGDQAFSVWTRSTGGELISHKNCYLVGMIRIENMSAAHKYIHEALRKVH